jgi:prevent-host-death family protein
MEARQHGRYQGRKGRAPTLVAPSLCGYGPVGEDATSEGRVMAEAGVRDLRDHLSRYLERVRAGEELTVTDRGRPISRLAPVDGPRTFDRLVAESLVARAAPRDRHRPTTRVTATGPVSELVTEQRR